MQCCPTCSRDLVPPSGPTDAELAFVGEGPGIEEFRRGEPFVGRTGKILRGLVEGVRAQLPTNPRHEGRTMMRMERIYLTNASRCLCPSNREVLVPELQALGNPLIIVPLGAEAWGALAPDGGNITASSGKLYWSDELGGWLYPSIHPAAMFYVKESKDAQELYMNLYYHIENLPDLLISGPPDDWRPKIHYITDVTKARRQIGKLRKYPKIAFDIESSSTRWYDGELGYLSLSPSRKESYVFPQSVLRDKVIRKLLSGWFGSGTTFVAHNAKFDDTFMRKHLGSCPENVEDTMLIEYCLDERPGSHLGLKSLGQREFHLSDWSVPMVPYKKNYLEAPEEIVVPYAGMDTGATFALHDLMEPRLDDAERRAYDLMLRASKMFEVLDPRGVYVSKKIGRDLQERLEKQAGEAKQDVIDFASEQLGEPWDINPGSYPQLRRLLYEVMQLPVLKRTQKGGPSTNAETLGKLKDRFPDIPLWQLVLDYRSAVKAAGTYIAPYLTKWGEDVPGHPDLRRLFVDTSLTSTETGRLSTSKGESPAIMTYPRDMRQFFVTGPPHYAPDSKPEDWIFWQLDASQLEFRLAAFFSQCEYALARMRQGISFHKIAAEAVWGPDYTEREYVLTKNFNFGSLYNLGQPAGISAGMDPDAAAAILKGYREKMPELFRWLLMTANKVSDPGYVETMFGRRRRFPFIPNAEMKHEMMKEAANFAVQSPASDITLECMMAVFHEYDQRDLTSLRWMMHDGFNGYTLLSQVPVLAEIWELVEQRANQLIDADPPILTFELKIGKDWKGGQEFATREEFLPVCTRLTT